MKKIFSFLFINIFILYLSSCVFEEKYENSFDQKTYQSQYDAWKELDIHHYSFTLSGPFITGKGYSYSIILEIENGNVISYEYPIPEIEKTNNKEDEYLEKIQNSEPYKSIKSIDDFFDYILSNYKEMTENPQPLYVTKADDDKSDVYYPEAVHCYVSYDEQYHFPKETTFRNFYEFDKPGKDYDTGGRNNSFTYNIKNFRIINDEQNN